MSLKSSISIVSLTVAMLAGPVIPPAYASDLNGSVKDGASDTFSPKVVNWTGFYIGGALGYGNANHQLSVQQYNGSYCLDKAALPEDFDSTIPYGHHGSLNDDKGGIYNTPEAGCELKDSDAANNGPKGAADFAIDASSKEVSGIDGVNSSGLVGDARLGFDIARGRFLFGVFGSYGFNSMETDLNNALGIVGNGKTFDVTSIEKGSEWSIGARAGVIVAPRTLAYILAAYTQTDYDFSGNVTEGGVTSGFSRETTFDGVTVGGGLEFALTQNVFLGIEGTHTFYGKETVLDTGGTEVGGFGQRITDDLDETKVMGTLKIKLNNGFDFSN